MQPVNIPNALSGEKRRVKEVSTGLQHSLFLTDDGNIYGLGDNARNQVIK